MLSLHATDRVQVLFAGFLDKKQHGFYETAGGDQRNKHGVNKSQWERNKDVQPKRIPKGNG